MVVSGEFSERNQQWTTQDAKYHTTVLTTPLKNLQIAITKLQTMTESYGNLAMHWLVTGTKIRHD